MSRRSVLIVDDSLVFRKAVEIALSKEPGIQIAGSVRNGEKALEFIRESQPDVVTLDVEMPGMNGIETLKAIQEFNASRPGRAPVEVIMLSSFTKKGADVTMEALSAGAFDFITKPETGDADESVESLKRQLCAKIRSIPIRERSGDEQPSAATQPQQRSIAPSLAKAQPSCGVAAIAIGVSTGGPKALNEMLPELCEKTKLPILIVQHMPPTFTNSLAKQLDAKCSHKVLEAEGGETVEDGHVYIAPGGRHMTIRRCGTKVQVLLTDSPPENGCRPSVDVLFRSVADVYGPTAIAVVMTGMGNDGSKACPLLRSSGARIIVQDEATSVVWGMPGTAVATGAVERIEPLMQIPKTLAGMISK